jgi:transcription initiation factor TFIID TATA-box-binding protein
MRITNVVYGANLRCPIDLRRLNNRLGDAKYDPSRFSGLVWRCGRIRGCCLLFSNGKIICNGGAASFKEGEIRLRRYARRLKRMGYEIRISDLALITASAYHTLSGSIDWYTFCKESGASYEPELFPTVMFKKGRIHFSCHLNGKLIITGIKSDEELDDVVYPTSIELEMYTI